MPPRVKIDVAALAPEKPAEREDTVKFFSSGSVLLDLVLGGGWARDRVCNIVGDRSAGKTLLAIEACANFVRLPDVNKNRIAYRESEFAFDTSYARAIGFPNSIEPFQDVETVEQLEADLTGWVDHCNDEPNLYVLDSLDALSDDAEMERKIGEASYGATKAKRMSELFRKINKRLGPGHTTLMVISQLRDKLNVRFGETKIRSGGKALDFYCSQIVWLAEVGKLKQTVKGVERVTGVEIEARTKKNKVGLPFRSAKIQIQFGYGIDDETSMLAWLKTNKAAPDAWVKATIGALDNARFHGDRAAVKQIHKEACNAVLERWSEIEQALEPTMRKYE